jgi:hypothetical protein
MRSSSTEGFSRSSRRATLWSSFLRSGTHARTRVSVLLRARRRACVVVNSARALLHLGELMTIVGREVSEFKKSDALP